MLYDRICVNLIYFYNYYINLCAYKNAFNLLIKLKLVCIYDVQYDLSTNILCKSSPVNVFNK